MTIDNELFDRAVAASGLAPLVAPFTLTRLLVRAGVTPRDLTPEQLGAALPTIAKGLSIYLTGDELDAALEALRRLSSPPPPAGVRAA